MGGGGGAMSELSLCKPRLYPFVSLYCNWLQQCMMCIYIYRCNATAAGHITVMHQDFCGAALCPRPKPCHVMLPGCGKAADSMCGKNKTCSK